METTNLPKKKPTPLKYSLKVLMLSLGVFQMYRFRSVLQKCRICTSSDVMYMLMRPIHLTSILDSKQTEGRGGGCGVVGALWDITKRGFSSNLPTNLCVQPTFHFIKYGAIIKRRKRRIFLFFWPSITHSAPHPVSLPIIQFSRIGRELLPAGSRCQPP